MCTCLRPFLRPTALWIFSFCLYFPQLNFTDSAVASGANKNQMSARNIIEEIQSRRDRVQRLLVEYSSQMDFDSDAIAAGLSQGFVIKSSCKLVFNGEHRRLDKSSYTAEALRAGTPTKERNAFYQGKSYQEQSSILSIGTGKSATTEANVYFNSLLWPFSDMEKRGVAEAKGNSHFLPSFFLEYAGELSLRKNLNANEGYTHEISRRDGLRTIWIDANNNFAIVKAEILNPIPGTSSWLYTYDNFIAHDDIAWPQKVTCKHTFIDKNGATDKVIGTATIHILVSRIEFGPFEESNFIIEPIPGQMVCNTDTGELYTYAAPTDGRIDASLAKIKTHILMNENPGQRHGRSIRNWTSLTYLVLGNVVVMVIILLVVIAKKSRAKDRH